MGLITMSKSGRLTLPADARHALGVDGETHFRCELRDGAIVLLPVVTLTLGAGDHWIVEPRHGELLRRALADLEEGRVVEIGSATVDSA
jgi:hypothetical protein